MPCKWSWSWSTAWDQALALLDVVLRVQAFFSFVFVFCVCAEELIRQSLLYYTDSVGLVTPDGLKIQSELDLWRSKLLAMQDSVSELELNAEGEDFVVRDAALLWEALDVCVSTGVKISDDLRTHAVAKLCQQLVTRGDTAAVDTLFGMKEASIIHLSVCPRHMFELETFATTPTAFEHFVRVLANPMSGRRGRCIDLEQQEDA